MTELVDIVADAVRRSVPLIAVAHPGEELVGYALCTDDDLSTLFHVAITREFEHRNSDVPGVAHVPTEWSYNEGEDLFEEANRIITARYEDASSNGFEEHVVKTFGELVGALERMRAEGVFEPDVLLIVTSTDPGPALEELSREAAEKLNSAEVFARWRDAMGYGAE
jgi:hypothetical protein